MKTKITIERASRLSRRVFQGAVWFGLLSVAHATNLIPAARQTKPLLLTGGTVVTVSGPVLAQADVLVVDGRISRIAPSIAPPAGADVINVKGRYVYPGLIAAQTHLGLVEIAALRQTVDTAELGAINPNARSPAPPGSARCPD